MVGVLFFASGAVGLVYEVLWTKRLALVLGSTATAQTFVLAVFMGGLALGAALLGRRADRSARPLRLYGVLELLLAAFGAGSPFLLDAAGVLPGPLRPAATVLILLAPTVLMGGTLPVLARWAVRGVAEVRRAVGALYFLNSIGAVFGTLLAGFVLIPAAGLTVPILLAAGVNAAIGAAALSLPEEPRLVPDAAAHAAVRPLTRAAPFMAAAFASGAAALAYEIGWIRLLALSLGSSTYAFSVMLSAFIGGLAAGGLLAGRKELAGRDPVLLFATAEVGAAFAILVSWPLYERLPFLSVSLAALVPRNEAGFHLVSAVKWLFCFLVMLPPAALLGAALPLAARAASRDDESVGGAVGAVFAANTAGCVLGAVGAGLLLMPAFGIKGVFLAGMLLNAAAAAAAAVGGGIGRGFAAAVAGALVACSFWGLSPELDRLVLASGTFRLGAAPASDFASFRRALRGNTTLFYKDGRDATITVERDLAETMFLKVNGKADASTGADMATQSLLAHVPLLLRPGAKDLLIIGLGSGVTAGAALRHPIERLDLVEISAGVVEASAFFQGFNNNPLADPRAALSVEDAKTFLERGTRRYDSVISEPSNPWIAGVGNLFTAEFYARVRSRLKPGGLMVQWFHLYEMSDETLRLVLRTFASAFPVVGLWNVSSNDILLIGSDAPILPDLDAVGKRLARPEVKEDLRRIGIGSAAALLSLESISDAGVRAAAGSGPLNRDLFPRLEYLAPLALFLDQNATLPARADERRSPETARDLLLPRALALRGRGLTDHELKDMRDFHGKYGGPLFEALEREYLKRKTGARH